MNICRHISQHFIAFHNELFNVVRIMKTKVQCSSKVAVKEKKYATKIKHSPGAVVKDYANNTSVHGIRYIVKSDTSILERVFWVVVFIVCSSYACTLVMSAWDKYKNSPTVIAVEATHYPLYMVDFPAITICAANRIKKNVAEVWIARYLNVDSLNDSMKYYAWRVMSVIGTLQFPFFYRTREHLRALDNAHILRLFNESFNVTQFSLDTLPTCTDMFIGCYWEGRAVNCCEVFHLQRSEAGYCYSFNSLTADDKKHCMMNDGMQLLNDSDEKCILWRNTGNGAGTGLELFLAPTKENVRLGVGQRDRNGYRVVLHDPLSFPESAKGQYVREWKDDTFTIRVTPTVTASSPNVKKLPISQRMCYFPHEGQLEIFNIYSQESCFLQCRVDFIVSKCGCQPYYFTVPERNIRECTLPDYWCILDLNDELRGTASPQGTPGIKFASSVNCTHCLPTCFETTYNLDTITSKDAMSVNTPADSYIDVHYKEPGFVKYRRSISFGTDDLLVSFGGVMGLFLGVSFLSGAEFLVYTTKLITAIIKSLWIQPAEEKQKFTLFSTTMSSKQTKGQQNVKPQIVWYN